MLTLKSHVALFPFVSDASHVTFVIPNSNSEPGFRVQLTTGFSTSALSVAVGIFQLRIALESPGSVEFDMLEGHLRICGGSISGEG